MSNINIIDTKVPSNSGLARKTKYSSKKQNLEKNEGVTKNISNTSGMVKKTG